MQPDQKKDLPSVEYSLKSISWHLKCHIEEQKKLNAHLEKLIAILQSQNTPF